MKNIIVNLFNSEKVIYLYAFFILTFGIMAYIDIKQTEKENKKLLSNVETSEQINSKAEIPPIITNNKLDDIIKYKDQIEKMKTHIAVLNKRLRTRVTVHPM